MSLFQKISIILPLAIFLSLSGEGWASTTKLVNSVQVDSAVLERKASIFVTMSNGTESILSMANSQTIQSDTENSLMRALEAHAKSTQAPVVSVLKRLGVAYESYWISNEIYIKDGSPSVVSALLDALPQDSGIVSEIREEIVVPIMPTFNSTEGEQTLENSWGLDQIKTPAAWATGARGQNIIVAVIDSGHNSHTDLQGKLVPGGWLDALSGRKEPFDDNGHGTHVSGTILGNNGIGVAPEARWVSCRACDAKGCPQHALIACAQFVRTKRARVVSCSWGIIAKAITKAFFDRAIEYWRQEGIIPVFAVGNDGKDGCGTVAYPAENNQVIAVGATGRQSTLADFSSRGPSARYPVKGGTKPDLSAPGVAIKSASHQGFRAHAELSGSSMAAPHVSGLVALLLSKRPGLTYDHVFDILKRNTERNVKAPPQTCGKTSQTIVPNNLFGHGEIRADKALNDRSLRDVDTKEEINQN